jgi:hypothetical protein
MNDQKPIATGQSTLLQLKQIKYLYKADNRRYSLPLRRLFFLLRV